MRVTQGLRPSDGQQLIITPEIVPGTFDPAGVPIACPDWMARYAPASTFDSFKAAGYNAFSWTAKVYEESQFGGDWRPSYNDIDKWLLALCGNPIVDETDAGVRHREYLLPERGRRSVLTYTIEWGDLEQVIRCPFGVMSGLSLSSDPGTGVRGNVSFTAQDPIGQDLPMAGTTDLLDGVATEVGATIPTPANLTDNDSETVSTITADGQFGVFDLGGAEALEYFVVDVTEEAPEGSTLQLFGGQDAVTQDVLLCVVPIDMIGRFSADIGNPATFTHVRVEADFTGAGNASISGIRLVSTVNTIVEADSLPVLPNHFAIFRADTRAGLYTGGDVTAVPNPDAFMPTCDAFEIGFANLINLHRAHDRTRTFRNFVDGESAVAGGFLRLPTDSRGHAEDMLSRSGSYLSGPSYFLLEALSPLAPYRFAIEWRAAVGDNEELESNGNIEERRFPLSRIKASAGGSSMRFITEVPV